MSVQFQVQCPDFPHSGFISEAVSHEHTRPLTPAFCKAGFGLPGSAFPRAGYGYEASGKTVTSFPVTPFPLVAVTTLSGLNRLVKAHPMRVL